MKPRKGIFIQMVGMSGSGKSTIAAGAANKLRDLGFRVEVIDGDKYRLSLCKDLSFSKKDRNENIRRLGFIGKVLARNNVISIMSAINPYDDVRKELMRLDDKIKLAYIECPLEVLKRRDTKGLYKRAYLSEDDPNFIPNLTGVNDPFEEPSNPNLIINTISTTQEEAIKIFTNFILEELCQPPSC